MTSVLLAGAYGQGNPGDEALLCAFTGAFPDCEVVATSSDPAATESVHGCEAIPPKPADFARALQKSDALVLGGGTVFKELHATSGRRRHELLERACASTLAARATGKPTALIGVGGGTLRGARSRSLARTLVRTADLLVLRDEESAVTLGRAGAPTPFRVGADLAWTVVRSRATELVPAIDGPVVVVPSVYAFDNAEELARVLIEALRPLAAAGVPIEVMPWQTGVMVDERPLAELLARRVAGTVIDAPTDLSMARDAMRGARLVVGFRFHSLVAAAAAGAPFLAVSHEPKLAAAARRLKQPSVAPGTGSAHLADAIIGAARAATPPSAAAIETEHRRADETLKLARLVLTNGHGFDPRQLADLPLYPEPR
jgi:polysaccharide pyruvyl transferase WcaK-like protein